MNYVESFNLFGIEAKEIPCIKGSGEPTTETVGAVGLLYMDTDTGDLYKCTAVNEGVYTWVALVEQDVVKSINGVSPDESGNVQIEVGSTSDLEQPEWGKSTETVTQERYSDSDFIYMTEEEYNEIMAKDDLVVEYYELGESEGWYPLDKNNLYYDGDSLGMASGTGSEWRITYTETVTTYKKIPSEYLSVPGIFNVYFNTMDNDYYGEYSCSATIDQIVAAIESGKVIVATVFGAYSNRTQTVDYSYDAEDSYNGFFLSIAGIVYSTGTDTWVRNMG